MSPMSRRALQYVANAQVATEAMFDEDHEPVGPTLRAELMPRYMVTGANGILTLTAEGERKSKGEDS